VRDAATHDTGADDGNGADFGHSLPADSSVGPRSHNWFGLADVFAQAGALLLGHRGNAGADAAQVVAMSSM